MGKIIKKYCEGRRSPFQLSWSDKGKRMSRFFDTEDARDDFLREFSYLDDLSFQGLVTIDKDAIEDIARIETMRGSIYLKIYRLNLHRSPEVSGGWWLVLHNSTSPRRRKGGSL